MRWLLFFALPVLACAQGARYDYQIQTTNVCQIGTLCPVLAVPGAAIRVSSTTYTTSTLGTPCGTNAPIVLQGTTQCVSNTDQYGNFGFWMTPGNYTYTVTFPTNLGGATYGPFAFTVGGGGGSGITQLTGDATAGPGTGSQVITLAPVNGNIGTCGDSTHVGVVTLNAKGLATGCTPVSIAVTGSPGGTTGQIQYNNSGAFGGISTSGSGSVCFTVGCVMTAPVLGTPASGNASNLTNLPINITTTGSSGASTWTQSTNTLNIPQYSGGGAGSPTFSVTFTSTVVSVPAWAYRNNNAIFNVPTIGTLSTASGCSAGSCLNTGAQIWVYLQPTDGLLHYDYNSAVTPANITLTNVGAAVNAAASNYPDCVVPIATITGGAVLDQWTAVTNAPLSSSTTCIQAGTNLTSSVDSHGIKTLSATGGGSSNPTVYKASAGGGTATCPASDTALNLDSTSGTTYTLPSGANISAGDSIVFEGYVHHTGTTSVVYFYPYFAGIDLTKHTGYGNVMYVGNNSTSYFRTVITMIAVGSGTASFNSMFLNLGGNVYQALADTPFTGQTVTSTPAFQIHGNNCSSTDTMQVQGIIVTVIKAAAL